MLRVWVTVIFLVTLLPFVLSLHLIVFAQKDPSSPFLEYTNRDYKVNIQYPANWTAQETNLEPNQVVFFGPNEFEEEYILLAAVSIFVYPTSLSSIDELMESSLTFYTEDPVKYRLVNESRTSLSGIPAFEITYYNYDNNSNSKNLETATLKGNESFVIRYSAEPGNFDKYLPLVKMMINSFNIIE